MFANQGNDDVCVYDGSDPQLTGLDLGGCGRRVAFCTEPRLTDDCGAVIAGGVLELWGEPLLELSEMALIGPHNHANAAAAAAAAASLGIEREAIADGLRSFAGVPHRLERVAEVDGVLYVNDSKATNVAAANAALRSFEGGVHVILGGSLKGGGFAALAAPVAERCRAAYLIGPAAEPLERALEPAWAAGVEHRRLDGLEAAVAAAAAAARPGEIVLLGARLRQLRRLPRFRGSRRGVPGRGGGARTRMISPPGGERGSDVHEEALASLGRLDRALAVADRDALPARLRRGHGLQRQLDHLAAR